MNTKKQAAKRSGLSLELINAVIDGLNDPSQIADVYSHGAAAGYGAFIYYSNTVPFAEAHRKEISRKIKELAAELDDDAVSFMASFGCLRTWDDPKDPTTRAELRDAIGFFIYSTGPEDEIHEENDLSTQVFNAAAWFALEEVARAMMEKD